MIRFYTTPPTTVQYPYVLINAANPQIGYVRKHGKVIQSIIIDSGIEIFRNPFVKDYPSGHVYRMVKLYNKVKSIAPNAEVYLTCPDYCDDYNPKALWLSDEITNVERTVQNVLLYTKKFPHVSWLIPVQGWNKQPKSIVRCIEQYREHGVLDRYDYYAVGNLCVETRPMVVYQTCRIAKENLSGKKIHVFGLKLNALKYVADLIDSFDSTAWTRPVNSRLNANWSCKNSVERERFFTAWLERLNSILLQATSKKVTLDNFM